MAELKAVPTATPGRGWRWRPKSQTWWSPRSHIPLDRDVTDPAPAPVAVASRCGSPIAVATLAAISRFKDTVIQDGSSFALKKQLRDVFPRRFTTGEPADIEVHTTYSGLSDEVCSIQIAPDKQAERPFLPDPSTPQDRLLLADRGYPSDDSSRRFGNKAGRSS